MPEFVRGRGEILVLPQPSRYGSAPRQAGQTQSQDTGNARSELLAVVLLVHDRRNVSRRYIGRRGRAAAHHGA
jgi:hypothetical protein